MSKRKQKKTKALPMSSTFDSCKRTVSRYLIRWRNMEQRNKILKGRRNGAKDLQALYPAEGRGKGFRGWFYTQRLSQEWNCYEAYDTCTWTPNFTLISFFSLRSHFGSSVQVLKCLLVQFFQHTWQYFWCLPRLCVGCFAPCLSLALSVPSADGGSNFRWGEIQTSL